MDKVKVLLVEDDEDDYVLTHTLLSEINEDKFTLEWVRTYDAALDRIKRSNHDVCLLDYRLGTYNGLELLHQTRVQNYNVPVILLTGQADREIDIEAMKAGAADFLIKSQLNAATLERSIRYAIQHRQLEEERIQHTRDQEARAQAEAANRAKDDFLATVSHELRTPLNAMLGWIHLLQIGKDDEETFSRALEAIASNAKLQAQIVEDLLDISRIINGQLRLEPQLFELSSVVETSINTMRPVAADKAIQLEVVIDNSVGLFTGDPVRLQQVVNNLLSNAIKFSSEGGRVQVSLERAGEEAIIRVSDTGKGISAEFLPYVFDRYRQAKDATLKRQGGLGLGLAIVRHLVELHGGTVRADSDGEGQGATFTVRLPLKVLADNSIHVS